MGCITNSGYISAATKQSLMMAAAVGVDIAVQTFLASVQRDANRSIAQMQEEIARRQLALAQAIQTHAEQFWPYESQLVDEAYNEAFAYADYDDSHVNGFVSTTITPTIANVSQQERTQPKLPAIAKNIFNTRYARTGALIEADLRNSSYRISEARATAFNDRRYERRYKILGLGKGILSEVTGFQRASGVAGSAAANMMGSAINSMSNLLGYAVNRLTPSLWGYGSKIRDTWQSQAQNPFPDKES